MTRKDYILIADAIKSSTLDERHREKVVYTLAYVLRNDNERFDYDKFVTACGIGVAA